MKSATPDGWGSGSPSARTPAGRIAAPAARPDTRSMARLLVGVARDLLYLTLALVTSVLAGAVWIAGLSLALTLGILVVGLPVVLAVAYAFRWTGELDRMNARLLLRRRVEGEYADLGGRGFFSRLGGTLADPQTWRDLAWLIFHSIFGFAFGVAAVTLAATTLGLLLLPAWAWSIPGGVQVGVATVDEVWEAFLWAPLALPLGVLSAILIRAMASAHVRVARILLGARAASPAPVASYA